MEILNLEHNYRILIKKAINKTKNMRDASKLLGIEKRTLYNWMKNLNIKRHKKYGEVI